jgi:hypothetical protein
MPDVGSENLYVPLPLFVVDPKIKRISPMIVAPMYTYRPVIEPFPMDAAAPVVYHTGV